MSLYILYSADYELFLGGNYCDENEVLINPTNDLLNIFDNLKIPLTLFADIFSLLRYKELELFSYPENAENQLKDAIRRDHDVQSHIHPHWSYTKIEGNKYKFDLDYCLLGKLDNNKEELYSKIRNYLLTSRIYLHDLLRQVNKNYNCIAFRCGGYGLQPNSNMIIKALIDTGFIIDSSVVPNLIYTSNYQHIDFSIVPKKSNYYLDYDLTASKSSQGIFEIPIASCKFNIIDSYGGKFCTFLKILKNKMDNSESNQFKYATKGYSIQQIENYSGLLKYYKYIQSFSNRFYLLDCTTNEKLMFKCTKLYLKQFDFINQDIFFSFNMHPKMMTKEHFGALKVYHKNLISYYGENIKAISFQRAAKILNEKKGFNV